MANMNEWILYATTRIIHIYHLYSCDQIKTFRTSHNNKIIKKFVSTDKILGIQGTSNAILLDMDFYRIN